MYMCVCAARVPVGDLIAVWMDCWMYPCVCVYRCWICVFLFVQVCDGGRVRVFVLDGRAVYLGLVALARAEQYDGIHIPKINPGLDTASLIMGGRSIQATARPSGALPGHPGRFP